MDIYQKALEAYRLVFGEPDLNTFDGRLKFQKTIYLLKSFGIDFEGLSFTWYKRGPYCFDLVGIKYREIKEKNNLSEEEIEKINNVSNKISSLFSDMKNAELFSSIAYLSNDEKLSDEKIIERLELIKPWFTKEEVIKSIGEVKSFLLNN